MLRCSAEFPNGSTRDLRDENCPLFGVSLLRIRDRIGYELGTLVTGQLPVGNCTLRRVNAHTVSPEVEALILQHTALVGHIVRETMSRVPTWTATT